MNFQNFVKSKKLGFWVTVSLIVLSLITAFTYIGCFNNTDEMNYWAFAFLLIGAVAGIVLIAFKKYSLAPYVVALCAFLSLLFYIYAVYYYVSVVMVGIDKTEFSNEFVISTVLFAITSIVGIADVFMGQTKKIETTEEVVK